MPPKHSKTSLWVSKGVFDSLKTFNEFEERVTSLMAINTKAGGDVFEIFVEGYLATQPAMQSEDSWPVSSIPAEVRESLNLPSDSKGIDGVYHSLAGHYVPYQVKFRSKRPALGFSEVAPFLGITERATDRLLITNCDSIATDVKNRTGLRTVRGVDFDTMIQEDFELISRWLKSRPAKRPRLTPLPHQIRALDDISRHQKEYDRGTVVMACGTGKTLVGLWAAERSGAKTILVLVPSLTLMQQTLEEWSRYNSWGKDFTYLCVCSDPQVDLKSDEIEIEPSDLPFRVDTDPALVSDFLARENNKVKVVFSTYQSSEVVAKATRGKHSFDVGIFDEAHKTTGPSAGRFATALSEESVSIRKRLFFTATPKHYDLRRRDKEGDLRFVSMDDEMIYGKRIHTLTFGEAASAGIICPYKVLVTLIDKTQVDDFSLKHGLTMVGDDLINAKWVANQVAIDKAIQRTSAQKVITFHSRVRAALDFASDQPHGVKWFLKDFTVLHVNGQQRSNDRRNLISKFRKADRSLITNARCLTEGVDVPAVDMVAFLDPRQSKIDIAQAIGRAMRKPRDSAKAVGYVVVPIYSEGSDTQSVEKALKNEGFESIALVLGALLEQDEDFLDIVRELNQDRGRRKVFNPRRLTEKIELVGPDLELERITSSLCLAIIEKLGASWDLYFGALCRYSEEHGDALVPTGYTTENGLALSGWVNNQRNRRYSLPASRRERLEALPGWAWNTLEAQWEENFNALLRYSQDTGSARVPKDFRTPSGYRLGEWIKTQRASKDAMSASRRERLEALPGWAWNTIEAQWEENFNALLRYSQDTGSARVPKDFRTPSGYRLGSWIAVQRRNKDAMSASRRERLEALPGWAWNALEAQWEAAFRELQLYSEEHGTVLLPDKFKTNNGFSLGSWVFRQRSLKDSMPIEKRKRLEALSGWVWDRLELDLKWQRAFDVLQLYIAEHGDALVPATFKTAEGFPLGAWVRIQRREQHSMLASRREKLEALQGWAWSPFEARWERAYEELSRYVDENGDALVPSLYRAPSGFRLGAWVNHQRTQRGSMPDSRRELLEAVPGWVWAVAVERP